MPDSSPVVVNHHANHPGFAGPGAVLFALALLAVGRARARLAVERAGVTAADHLVDVGCGAGGGVRAAARRGARATGVDPAPVMLRTAQLTAGRGRRIDWARGTAERLPLADGSATVAWSLATVHHWRDVGAGLAEIHRVLSPAGRVVAIERQVSEGATGPGSHGWTGAQANRFAALCLDAGFTDIEVAGHGHGRGAVWVVRGVRP